MKRLLFLILFLWTAQINAQDTLLIESFESGAATFSLNSVDLSSTATGFNDWVINSDYAGGSDSFLCLSDTTFYTLPNTPAQPLGIAGAPVSAYLHTMSDEAQAAGIFATSFMPADSVCYPAQNHFAGMNTDVNTIGRDSVKLSFWWTAGGSAANFGEVYYSIDQGVTWVLITSPISSYFSQAGWLQTTIEDTTFNNQATLRFGFRFVNQIGAMTTPDAGFAIDDLVITSAVACPTPTANFIYAAGPYPSIDFNDASGSTGPLTWSWDFGDGNTDTVENATHDFSFGSWEVCLTVTDSCGSDTYCDSVTIGCPPVFADFGFTVTELQANFSDSSVAFDSTTTLSYAWDFGDGHVDSTANPSINYAVPGSYVVCLTVSDSCSQDTWCDTVTVTCPPPSASFSDSIIDNSAILRNETSDSSTFPISFVWDFGNGNTATTSDAIASYDSTGTYTICLIATTLCGSDTACAPVSVTCEFPVADFSVNGGSYTLEFQNQTTTISDGESYHWDFGDGDISSAGSPLHTFDTTSTFFVCLEATNVCGVDTFCDSVTVVCPPPSVGFSNSSGNMAVQFTNTSTTGDLFPFWVWDFGNGVTSNARDPLHNYSLTGDYTVCLTIVDECGSDSVCQQINVCQQPVAGFIYNNTFEDIVFTDQSTGPEISTWWWSFGDGGQSSTQNPTYTYGATGTYTVCLGIENPCGTDTTCTSISILTSSSGAELENEWQVSLWPNPAGSEAQLQFSRLLGSSSIEIFDLNGRHLQTMDTQNSLIQHLDLTDLSAGYYIVRVFAEGSSVQLPLVIRK